MLDLGSGVWITVVSRLSGLGEPGIWHVSSISLSIAGVSSARKVSPCRSFSSSFCYSSFFSTAAGLVGCWEEPGRDSPVTCLDLSCVTQLVYTWV